MSDTPINSTAKVYRDSEDNDVTLRQLIRAEPEWAHNIIKWYEEKQDELSQANKEIERLRDENAQLRALTGE